MTLARCWRHLTTPRARVSRAFPAATLTAIEHAISASERSHSAEIRCVLEPALNLSALQAGMTPRVRALELFASLAVWDTARNNGVLVYILFADHAIEIVADRGFTGRVDGAEWREICAAAEAAFARGEFAAGSLALVERVGALAASHFPADPAAPANVDELPDSPLLL
jgi:uncharacterized membrane protein